MTHYKILDHNKSGQPRIKIIVEFGYDENGKRLRKMKTVTLPKLTETNIINAITQYEKSLGTEQHYFTKPKKLIFKKFSEQF